MRFTHIRFALLVGLSACTLLAAGCQAPKFSSTILNPLNLKVPFLPYREPIRIGLVHDREGIFDPARWDVLQVGSPWTPLRRQMQQQLDAPVQIEDLEPFQVAIHLQSGWIDFAFLSADDYLAMAEEFGEIGRVIALSEVEPRQGLIVANAKSDIHSLTDIRGQRFAFGPKGDPVLDDAAKQVLAEAGVLNDVQRELVPIPNDFQYHISSRESAFEVVFGLGTNVGVIERSEYEDYPDSGGSFLLRTFGKDNFRILAETAVFRKETIPEGPFLVSSQTNSELAAKMAKFLLEASEENRSALMVMGLSGFRAPPADVDGEIQRMAATTEDPPGQHVFETPESE